jgi:hypothetical protein
MTSEASSVDLHSATAVALIAGAPSAPSLIAAGLELSSSSEPELRRSQWMDHA